MLPYIIHETETHEMRYFIFFNESYQLRQTNGFLCFIEVLLIKSNTSITNISVKLAESHNLVTYLSLKQVVSATILYSIITS